MLPLVRVVSFFFPERRLGPCPSANFLDASSGGVGCPTSIKILIPSYNRYHVPGLNPSERFSHQIIPLHLLYEYLSLVSLPSQSLPCMSMMYYLFMLDSIMILHQCSLFRNIKLSRCHHDVLYGHDLCFRDTYRTICVYLLHLV